MNADILSVQWGCHLHGSSAKCRICRKNNTYYHIIPLNEISKFAQTTYNVSEEPDEFWEELGSNMFVSTIANCTIIRNVNVMGSIFNIFKYLDDNHLKVFKYNLPSDFVKRHIVTDGNQNVCLVNKYLIRNCTLKQKKKQVFYTSNKWSLAIINELFPKVKSQNIPVDTPSWVLDILKATKKKSTKSI